MTCVLCTEHHPQELWRDSTLYVIDAADENLPGFIRVVMNRHVAEMSDLTDAERVHLWTVLNVVEKVMRETMSPDKVNLAEFGNMVPHVHWHIIARYRDDAFFPEAVWAPKVRTEVSEKMADRRAAAERMKTDLVAALTAL